MTDVWRVWHAGHLELERCEPASGLIKLVGKMEGGEGEGPRQAHKTNNLQCYVYRCLMQLHLEIYRSTEAERAVAAC